MSEDFKVVKRFKLRS